MQLGSMSFKLSLRFTRPLISRCHCANSPFPQKKVEIKRSNEFKKVKQKDLHSRHLSDAEPINSVNLAQETKKAFTVLIDSFPSAKTLKRLPEARQMSSLKVRAR